MPSECVCVCVASDTQPAVCEHTFSFSIMSQKLFGGLTSVLLRGMMKQTAWSLSTIAVRFCHHTQRHGPQITYYIHHTDTFSIDTNQHHCSIHMANENRARSKNKLAPYGTGGRLLLTANFKVTWNKNWDKNQKFGPIRFRYCPLI